MSMVKEIFGDRNLKGTEALRKIVPSKGPRKGVKKKPPKHFMSTRG